VSSQALRVSLQPPLQREPSELQSNLEELDTAVRDFVLVDTRSNVLSLLIEWKKKSKSDLLLDYFKTSGWKQSLIDFEVKQRVAYSLNNY